MASKTADLERAHFKFLFLSFFYLLCEVFSEIRVLKIKLLTVNDIEYVINKYRNDYYE